MRAYSIIFASLILLAAYGCTTGNSSADPDENETGGTSNAGGGTSKGGSGAGTATGGSAPGTGGTTTQPACDATKVDDFTLAQPMQFWQFSSVTPETLEIKKRED